MSYHKDIGTISLHAWRQCTEHNLLKYTRIEPHPELNKGKTKRKWVRFFIALWNLIVYRTRYIKLTKETDNKAWEVIYDSNLAEFGIGEDYQYVLDLKRQIANINNEIAITGNRFLKNKLRHVQKTLDDILEKEPEHDINSAITYLGQWLGSKVDQHKTTYREFRYMLRDYGKEVQAQKANKTK